MYHGKQKMESIEQAEKGKICVISCLRLSVTIATSCCLGN